MVQGKNSRIMAALLACSMTGGVLPVSAGAAGEDGSMDPARTELIVNGDFEGGSFEWSSNYGGITAEDIVSDPLEVNGSSLYVSERWNAYAAPLYYIDAEPGKTYTLSTEIMYDESEYEEMDFQLLCGVRVEDDARLGEYLNKTQTVKKGVWTEITAECTIPGDADDLENICIAVQSSDDVAGWETGISFYLDNVSVTVESGPARSPLLPRIRQ